MNERLKSLLNEELRKIDQPLIDCGDEWTELIERVDEVRCKEASLAALREVREMLLDRVKQILNEQMSQDRRARYEEASTALDRINALIKREEER